MNTKIFEFDNLSLSDVIVVTSKLSQIDFIKEITNFSAYFNDSKVIKYFNNAEIYVSETNQKNTTFFELPVYGKKMKLVIKASGYDVDLLIAQPRP